jgi:hypothetical protein
MSDAPFEVVTQNEGAFPSREFIQQELINRFLRLLREAGTPVNMEEARKLCEDVGEHEGYHLEVETNELGLHFTITSGRRVTQ